MPTYQFEDEAGQLVELYLTMREAPTYGDWIEVAGRRLKRVVERNTTPALVPDYTCVVRSQPRWDPTAPRYDERGHGVILSKREHADYKAKNPHLAWE